MAAVERKFKETVRITVPADARIAFEKKAGDTRAITASDSEDIGQSTSSNTTGGKLYQELLSSIYDGLLITSNEGRIVEVNYRAAHLLHYAPQEFVKLTITDLIDGADEELLQQIDKSTQGGRNFTLIEAHCIRKNGSTFPAEIVVHGITLTEENQFCFFIRDISKRIQMERELLRLSKSVESAGDAIAIIDDHNNLIYKNPAFKKLIGDYARAETDEAGGFARVFADAEVLAEARLEISAGRNWNGEVNVRTSTGKTLPTLFRADSIQDEDGVLLGTVGIWTDITELKKVEKQLKQALTEVERSNSELAQFAYVASHDLQEPLRAISGYLKILQDTAENQVDDTAKHYIASALNGAERMQNLIKDLLSYSRLDTKSPELQELELETVLKHALANLRVMITSKDAKITYDELPVLITDYSQMLQLFQNLIGNALKFIDGVQPKVHLSAEKHADEWLFKVTDNGIGMQPDQAGRIFMIFQRLHSQQDFPGAGIGLAICKKIVERFGGCIWVDKSSPGEGSTFAFTLPVNCKKDIDCCDS